MKPMNDLAKVRLDPEGFIAPQSKPTAESGILVEVPDIFHYFGFWSFAFENSFMNEEALKKINDYWQSKVGRRVYWTALSERGNILEKDGDKFAFVKLTSLIAEDEPDSAARNVHADGEGSFGLEQ